MNVITENNPLPGKICVSIGGNDIADTLSSALRVEEEADVIEIRLDGLTKPEIAPFIERTKKPLLFTNRPEWEGGLWCDDETKRLALLKQAISAHGAYVDIELRTEQSLRREIIDLAAKNKSKTIVSWHDFQTTPSAVQLENILHEQIESGADIGKIVTMAHDYNDVLRVLSLQTMAHEKNFPLIAFCMGEAGRISRLATLDLGGYMTYAAPESGKSTAPGQLSVSTLHHLLNRLHHEN